MNIQSDYQPYQPYQPQPTRRGLGFRGAVLILIVGLIIGVIGGGVAGGLVATSVLRQAPAASASNTSAIIPITASSQQNLATSSGNATVQAVKKVGSAVVTVVNTMSPQQTYDFFGFGGVTQPTASGSGVIVSPDGYIVTNNHVIENFQSLQVIYADGSKADATLIGADQYADLAVIKVSGDVPGVAQLGDSTQLQIGEGVIAIGSALGDFKNTVTAGVVSAVNRSLDTGNGFTLENLIQTDAAINHGNSGGPLINMAGQVIGINTAIVRTSGNSGDIVEGVGFAIPAQTVSDITSQLIKHGYVDRPYLGVRWQMITPEIAKANNLPIDWGVYVQQVDASTASAQSGLQRGDIITAIGSDQINGDSPFFNVLNRHAVGEATTLTVWRNGSTLTLNITLQSRPR